MFNCSDCCFEVIDREPKIVEQELAGEKVGKSNSLGVYTKITIETEEKNPIAIAEITLEGVKVADGYRVRLTPRYD